MFLPEKDDPLRNRRLLAMLTAVNGFFIFPALIIFCSFQLKISDELCKHLLNYMGVSVIAPITGYLYAAHNKDKKNDDVPH